MVKAAERRAASSHYRLIIISCITKLGLEKLLFLYVSSHLRMLLWPQPSSHQKCYQRLHSLPYG